MALLLQLTHSQNSIQLMSHVVTPSHQAFNTDSYTNNMQHGSKHQVSQKQPSEASSLLNVTEPEHWTTNTQSVISLNWFVSVRYHVAWKYHIQEAKPDKLTPMCIHCSLQTHNNSIIYVCAHMFMFMCCRSISLESTTCISSQHELYRNFQASSQNYPV